MDHPGVAAWLIAPIVAASLLVLHLFTILEQADRTTLGWALLWGAVWGVVASPSASPSATWVSRSACAYLKAKEPAVKASR